MLRLRLPIGYQVIKRRENVCAGKRTFIKHRKFTLKALVPIWSVGVIYLFSPSKFSGTRTIFFAKNSAEVCFTIKTQREAYFRDGYASYKGLMRSFLLRSKRLPLT